MNRPGWTWGDERCLWMGGGCKGCRPPDTTTCSGLARFQCTLSSSGFWSTGRRKSMFSRSQQSFPTIC
eukprot:scaffold11400_cov134-Isochrysis_galbana.AAC.6